MDKLGKPTNNESISRRSITKGTLFTAPVIAVTVSVLAYTSSTDPIADSGILAYYIEQATGSVRVTNTSTTHPCPGILIAAWAPVLSYPYFG
ncbi:MAG: hypothetical protein QM571_07445 [Micrococcaceae bacterium]